MGLKKFNFYIPDASSKRNGEFSVGDPDKSLYMEPVLTETLLRPNEWKIAINRIFTDRFEAKITVHETLIDSGSFVSILETQVVKNIAKLLKATPIPERPRYYTVNCNLMHSGKSLPQFA